MKNFTIKQFIKTTHIDPKLVRSVISTIGGKSELEYALDTVRNGGASAGVSGFIYYSETVSFWRKNKKQILELINNEISELGYESAVSFVVNFNCLGMNYSSDEVGAALYGNYNDDLTCIYNALAWFALESFCYDVERFLEGSL